MRPCECSYEADTRGAVIDPRDTWLTQYRPFFSFSFTLSLSPISVVKLTYDIAVVFIQYTITSCVLLRGVPNDSLVAPKLKYTIISCLYMFQSSLPAGTLMKSRLRPCQNKCSKTEFIGILFFSDSQITIVSIFHNKSGEYLVGLFHTALKYIATKSPQLGVKRTMWKTQYTQYIGSLYSTA